MAVVTRALPSVLAKLGDLLVGEYKLQKGVKGDIVFLKAELESMKGAVTRLALGGCRRCAQRGSDSAAAPSRARHKGFRVLVLRCFRPTTHTASI
ncbi:unnamed protein product [Urochloa humidicola]